MFLYTLPSLGSQLSSPTGATLIWFWLRFAALAVRCFTVSLFQPIALDSKVSVRSSHQVVTLAATSPSKSNLFFIFFVKLIFLVLVQHIIRLLICCPVAKISKIKSLCLHSTGHHLGGTNSPSESNLFFIFSEN